ncbi:MAG: ribonuclease Y [Planctomycetota bacterium]|nr:ribonuclease Y [Planctomycetota bacterium]
MDLTIGAAAGAALLLVAWLWWRQRATPRTAPPAEAAAAQQALAAERAALAGERQQALEERARLAAERERLQGELERLRAERAQLESERSRLLSEEARLREAWEAARVAEQRLERRESAALARDAELAERERALIARETAADHRLAALDERDAALRRREQEAERRSEQLAERERAVETRQQQLVAELARIASLTQEQAREELLARLDRELAAEQSARIAAHERRVQERARELALEIVTRAIQRYAAEHTAETTSARIALPSEEYKGRIIGKEGRNIKAFEQLAGVDVLIDEAPDEIQVSCFDPVRREIAVRALKRLIDDGRIQPARIEEELARARTEIDREIQRYGEDAAYRCEVSGLHPQLIRLLGKLHFRTSYGQNVLAHVQEVAFLCGAMAADLGLDPRLARRCGLLHDIGKAIDHEQEGSHPQLGYEALKRYGESEIVANAALAHHEGQEPLTAYTVLAAAADAISAARPGARRANLEQYLKRLAHLEEIAVRYPGVQKAYAIQAGRELRVIVNQHTVSDAELPKLARDISRAIAEQVAFPGEIKVTLIRESRHTAVAR